MDSGETRAAVACLKRLTQIEPRSADAWQNLAVALFLRNRFEEGIGACEEALRCDPGHLMAYFNQALALERLRRYDEALASIRSALAIDPNDVALQKLEFRVRLLKIRGKVVRALRGLWPFGRGTAAATLPKPLD
jgi:tetratricopeptide (TPR) repeat protein